MVHVYARGFETKVAWKARCDVHLVELVEWLDVCGGRRGGGSNLERRGSSAEEELELQLFRDSGRC
jgi:hypothetical protein